MLIKPIHEIEKPLKKAGEECGIEVVEVVFKQGANPALTVYIDKEGGVDLDTCEAFHKKIDALLDEIDPTYNNPYTLNVSSLGLDRPFKTEADYIRNLNTDVEFKLYSPVMGKKSFEGKLISCDKNTFTVALPGGGEQKFEKTRVAKITKLIVV